MLFINDIYFSFEIDSRLGKLGYILDTDSINIVINSKEIQNRVRQKVYIHQLIKSYH